MCGGTEGFASSSVDSQGSHLGELDKKQKRQDCTLIWMQKVFPKKYAFDLKHKYKDICKIMMFTKHFTNKYIAKNGIHFFFIKSKDR